MKKEDLLFKKGDKIKLTHMGDDPDPIPVGTTGTILSISGPFRGEASVTVKWDIRRSLSLIWPIDQFEVLPADPITTAPEEAVE